LFFIRALATAVWFRRRISVNAFPTGPSLAADDFRLAFWRQARKIARFMESQETTAADFLFKLMPWFEANLKRLAYGAVFILIAVFIFSFYSYRQNQTEIAAGQALTQVLVSTSSGGLADACLKIAADYSGTLAGQRALLQGATVLFTNGKYPEAQTQFQKFLDKYPDNFFTPQAMLGVAASLDAQGKTDLAFSAYQRAAGQSADQSVVAAAKLGLAQIDEAQGKIADALKLYTDVARAYPNSSTGSEAGRRALELKIKSPTATVAPAPAVAAPFTLSH
jgi:predicted negative regulator of RcsB-dependent stress response